MSADSGPAQASYGDADRPLESPSGRYDPERVAAAARTADPGLPEQTARELAVYAGEHLREVKELDAPEIARRLFADHREAGASAANFVAKAAVDHCRENEVRL